MPKLTLAIPYFNQLMDTKGSIGQLKMVTSDSVEWLVVDNGSTDPVEEFFRKYVRPKRFQFIRNEENLGLVKTYQQIFDAVKTPYLAILHNDVFIYEKNWDKRLVKAFETIDKLGMVGFFGSAGVGHIGERIHDVPPGRMSGVSNMLEAEVHGVRADRQHTPVAILDGFALGFNMEFVKKCGGIDQNYKFHHIYDRELPLLSIAHGYKNIVLDVPCHHGSGVTANRPEYQQWIAQKLGKKLHEADKHTHDTNTDYFIKKWKKHLPLYVQKDHTLKTGPYMNRQFTDQILKWKK